MQEIGGHQDESSPHCEDVAGDLRGSQALRDCLGDSGTPSPQGPVWLVSSQLSPCEGPLQSAALLVVEE